MLRSTFRTKKFSQQIKTTKNPEVFQEHRTELTAYQAASVYFKTKKIPKLPRLKQLESEREQLVSEKARFYEAYREAKKHGWNSASHSKICYRPSIEKIASKYRKEDYMTQTLRIDPEFKAQISPLPQKERKQLEENILAESVLLAPIPVWNETIVNGYNCYEILQSHLKIPYSVRDLELETRDEVLVWIYKHQLGRRNLTPEQKKFLIGKRYDAEKQADGFHGDQHMLLVPSAGAQNEHLQAAEKICE